MAVTRPPVDSGERWSRPMAVRTTSQRCSCSEFSERVSRRLGGAHLPRTASRIRWTSPTAKHTRWQATSREERAWLRPQVGDVYVPNREVMSTLRDGSDLRGSDRDEAFRTFGYVACWDRQDTFH